MLWFTSYTALQMSARIYNRKGGRVSYYTMVQCNSCRGKVMTFIIIFMCVEFDLWWRRGNCNGMWPLHMIVNVITLPQQLLHFTIVE